MDGHYLFASREDLCHIEQEVKGLYATQLDHSERLVRLERKRQDDARMKNVWGNSAFPLSPLASFGGGSSAGGGSGGGIGISGGLGLGLGGAGYGSGSGSVGSGVLGGEAESFAGSRAGTPGVGFSSALNPGAEPFRGSIGAIAGGDGSVSGQGGHDDGVAEHRRPPASRANSVRFIDETSIQPPSSFPISPYFPPATSRSLTDIAQSSSRYGYEHSIGGGHGGAGGGAHLTNQPSSYRSDGRVGTAQSFRTNSLTAASVHGQDGAVQLATIMDKSSTASTPLAPPPGLLYLGPVPCIIRCWLTTPFTNETLIYGAVCSGSYHSTIGLSLVRKLGLDDLIVVEPTGRGQEVSRSIKLPVYLPEASVYHSLRPTSPSEHRLPAVTVYFVIREDEDERDGSDAAIQVVLGSDVLRAHNADILFSQDRVTIIDDERNKISIPMVRPEDNSAYITLSTASEKQWQRSAKQQQQQQQQQQQSCGHVVPESSMSGEPDIKKAEGHKDTKTSAYAGAGGRSPSAIQPRDFSDLAKASRADRDRDRDREHERGYASGSPRRSTRPPISSRPSLESIETGVSAPTWQRGRQLTISSQEAGEGAEGVSANGSANGNGRGGPSVRAVQQENSRPKSRASEVSWTTSSSTTRNWNHQGGWASNGNDTGEAATATSYQGTGTGSAGSKSATPATVWGSWRREGGANGTAISTGSGTSGTAAGAFSRTNSSSDLPFRGGMGTRGGRNMKVLKPKKQASTRQASAGSSVEGQTPTDVTNGHGSGDDVPVGPAGSAGSAGWGDASGSGSASENRQAGHGQPPALKPITSKLRSSANPIGGASAFGWLNNSSASASASSNKT